MQHGNGPDASRPKPGCIHASLFGEFRLRKTGATVIPISNRRAKALLAILCLIGEEAAKREQLSKLMWLVRFESHARIMVSVHSTLLFSYVKNDVYRWLRHISI
jgi:hypothetical protein